MSEPDGGAGVAEGGVNEAGEARIDCICAFKVATWPNKVALA